MWRDGLAKGARRPSRGAGRRHRRLRLGSARNATLAALLRRDPRAIYVLRSRAALGVGRALMAAVARDLLAQGHASATLWVLEGERSRPPLL